MKGSLVEQHTLQFAVALLSARKYFF